MIRGRGVAISGLTVCCMILAGCASQVAPIPTSKEAQDVQRFPSKEDAVSAARLVYSQYLSASDVVSASGGQSLDPIVPYVSSAELTEEQESADYLRVRKLRIEGKSKLVKFQPQEVHLGSGAVTAYACVDFHDTRVRDSRDRDVTPEGRADRQTSVAKFRWQKDGLVLDEISAWSGDPIC